jgi:hypothetical protein
MRFRKEEARERRNRDALEQLSNILLGRLERHILNHHLASRALPNAPLLSLPTPNALHLPRVPLRKLDFQHMPI